MTERAKILDRIKKLLALSKSPNVHEAEMAMQKANELMTEYQIEFAEVLKEEAVKNSVEWGPTVQETETYRSFIWRIAMSAGKIFDTDVVRGHEQASFAFIGIKEDIVYSTALYEYLRDSWLSMVAFDTKNWKKENFYYPPRQYEVKQYKIGHGQGFSDAVTIRANELVRLRKKKVEATGTSLIVLKNQLVKDFLVGKTEKSKGPGFQRQEVGYSEGRERGEQIPLTGAVAEAKKTKIGGNNGEQNATPKALR